jgi:DNA-binding NarL/FixJ family response regulator
MNPSLSIVAMDSHPLYLEGLLHFLKSLRHVNSVRTCSTLDELLESIKQKAPDILFLELNLESTRYDGFTICKEITSRHKAISVIILSRYNAPHFIRFARECGASAYFDKQVNVALISAFIKSHGNKDSMNQYHVCVTPTNGQTLSFQNEPFELRYILTPMECRVMKLIVAGKEPKEIEQQLSISYDTFKTHRHHVYEKLHVRNEVELTQFAITNHLLTLDCSALPSYKLTKLPNTPLGKV